MFSQGEQDDLISDILRASYEAVDLEDLGTDVLPLLDRLTDTSTSLVFTFNAEGRMVPIAGSMSEVVPIYAQGYFASDPLQRFLRQANPLVLHSSRMPVWQEYLASAAHNECASPNGIDNFIHLRLSDCRMHDPGMIGIMLSRTFRQSDFNERDKYLLRRLLPALKAFGRRYARLDERIKAQPFVESLFEFSQHPTIALDATGGFIWASERAEALLRISVDGCKRVPEDLRVAAKKLGCLLSQRSQSNPLPSTVSIARDGQPPLQGAVRLARTRKGAYFVIVELEDPESTPNITDLMMRFELTKAETRVLQLISRGLTDREIGQRLFISFATVRSHVNHILAKMNVRSRTQAALLARGHEPTDNDLS